MRTRSATDVTRGRSGCFPALAAGCCGVPVPGPSRRSTVDVPSGVREVEAVTLRSLAICAAVGVDPALGSASRSTPSRNGDHLRQHLEIVFQLVRCLGCELLERVGCPSGSPSRALAELAIAAENFLAGLGEILPTRFFYSLFRFAPGLPYPPHQTNHLSPPLPTTRRPRARARGCRSSRRRPARRRCPRGPRRGARPSSRRRLVVDLDGRLRHHRQLGRLDREPGRLDRLAHGPSCSGALETWKVEPSRSTSSAPASAAASNSSSSSTPAAATSTMPRRSNCQATAPGRAEVAAVLREQVAHVGGGAVAVVGQRLDDDGHAPGP